MDITKYHRCKVISKNVSTEPRRTYKLSDEQLQYYKQNGFLVIKGLIDFTDLYNYKQHFIRICKGLESSGNMTVVKDQSLVGKADSKEGYINKLQDIAYDDVFMTYTDHPRLLDVVAQIIGDDINVIHTMFINKPPGSGEHPPHQDLHYMPHRPAEGVVAAWTAVDDVTVDNGCLWVAPGTHTGRLYRHGHVPGALKLYHGILDELPPAATRRVCLEMAPGDTVFFHPILVHGSGANTSKVYRKSVTAHYASAQCHLLEEPEPAQELARLEVEAEAVRRGLGQLDFATIWRLKSKEVRRKSQL